MIAWQIQRLTVGLYTQERRFARFSSAGAGLRAGLALAALLSIVGFSYISMLDYWFLDSVLPIASPWINFTLLLSGIVLAVTALCPLRKPIQED